MPPARINPRLNEEITEPNPDMKLYEGEKKSICNRAHCLIEQEPADKINFFDKWSVIMAYLYGTKVITNTTTFLRPTVFVSRFQTGLIIDENR